MTVMILPTIMVMLVVIGEQVTQKNRLQKGPYRYMERKLTIHALAVWLLGIDCCH